LTLLIHPKLKPKQMKSMKTNRIIPGGSVASRALFLLKNCQRTIGTGLLAAVLLAGLQPSARAVSYSLTNAWFDTNTIGHLVGGGLGYNRGVAYNAVSNTVFVASRTGAGTGYIDVFDGTTGTLLSGSTGISGANLGIDQIGIGDDGTLYGSPLATSVSSTSGSLTVYSWANWYQNPAPYAAYTSASGDAVVANFTGKRIGDTMAVSGSGVNTLILLGVGGQGTNFVLLHTTDGVNFTPTAIFVPTGLPSTAGNIYGITLYTNNSFLVQPGANASTRNVYLVTFPANFASQTTVTGTVLGNVAALPANYTVALNYAPQANLLAVAQTSSQPTPPNAVGVYSTTNYPTSLGLLATNTFATPNANGNATGAVALGGPGKTNFVYVLESNNGLRAYAIAIATQPVITTAPVGTSGVYPPYSMTVAVSGATPLAYQWLASNSGTNVSSTFTNIPNATNTSLTVNYSLTNYFEVVITNSIGSVTSTPVRVALFKPVSNLAVTNLWQDSAGQFSWLSASDGAERGIAYDTNSQRVVVGTTTGLYVLNGNNGTNIETLSMTGVSFGGLLGGCDQVGIADDGAVYAGNVVNSGGTFNLYRWSAPSNIVTAASAFSADPGNGGASSERWGDTLAVRGAGANTEILLASRASAPGGTNVALLTPNDGVGLTYSSTVIAVSNVPAGFAGYGLAFGSGNTFWAKSSGGDLYEIAFDPVAQTGTVVFDYKEPAQIPNALIGLGMDPINNILAGIQPNDTPNDLQLFQLTGTSDSPVLFDQAFFTSANANGNDNAAVTVKYPRAYALSVNNGIVAVTYGTPATTAATINTEPASVTAYTNVPSITFSVGVSGSLPLYYQWRFNGTNITGATASTLTVSNLAVLSKAGNYDVVVHNIAGSITSTPPAVLTLLIPVTSPEVTPVWSIGPGTNSSANDTYLTTSGYETRGLAFDLTTSNLFVADHAYIHEYNGTNGQYIGDLNTAGLPDGGVNGWVLDQLGVADDGTLYSCNLSLDGTAFSIISYSAGSYSANYAYGGATGGSDLNTQDPAGDRWGDTMAVRGSGTDTQILLGSYNGTNVALFTTSDGVNFMPTVIAVQGGVPAGFAGLGIAFGTNNTFYAKGGHSYNLRYVSFNTNANANIGTVLQLYLAGSQVPNDLTGLGVDVTNNILGGVCYNDTPHDAQLYLLSGNTNSPALFEQDFFPAANANAQENSVVTLKGGWGFALDVNNGIVAFTYALPSAPAVALTSVAYGLNHTTLNWNNTFDGHSYQVQYKTSLLDASWTNLGAPQTASDAALSYTDTTASGGTRFYRVISQ
jgi:hypothetical protein